MEKYVDGFLIPIAKDKVNKYREIAQKSSQIWKDLGALEYYECIGDDLDIEELVSFKKVVNASEEETVIFSWIVYESKEQRDKVNEAVMNDPRMKEMMETSEYDLFDYRRMSYGGFKTLVSL
ncbi:MULTISPECIES: DUF1428 domain-containing protein [Methanosarcina]|jgi:uncharacterized protein YbaA (DUF1428 family)|uniref:DUF1428 domain-containing protein n=8 Tax=Methanosarcina mazei TaxID=2209 RepID=A0A0F8PAI5_METMZ|nr:MULTISPECIES: DUF1428 domain-containing protein [Methanosarcina]AAM29708.1 RNA signal recognition particle 4.5S RNA [Methanosarcina mazei Go1]AGF95473.1 RNA signal recognition particle 4.5S RNA [Methanosarcina mazei Tuc01]AKB40275.1 Protein of unknown function DUF1428 [Methanosarcina mazei WWM610]AKB61205.1 Protein of unknown function DUF1428 [Methanosarcina mazei SarPi]AKB64509.1 Protein of unknown function DUF1428 [Methanosarcina mazei S-6]